MFSYLFFTIDCDFSCLFDKIAEELIRAKKKTLLRVKDKLAKPIYWNMKFKSKAIQLVKAEEYIVSHYAWMMFNEFEFLFDDIRKIMNEDSGIGQLFLKRYLEKISEFSHLDLDRNWILISICFWKSHNVGRANVEPFNFIWAFWKN